MQKHIHICETCDRAFGSKAVMERHKRRKTPCVKKESPAISEEIPDSPPIASRGAIPTRSPETLASPQNAENSRDDIPLNHDGVVDVRVNSFGRESQSHLEDVTFDTLKSTLKLTPESSTLTAMIKFINFNPAVPENHNVKFDDHEHLAVFRGGRWTSLPKRAVILDLIGRNRLRFYDIEAVLMKNMKKKNIQNLDEYLDNMESIANEDEDPNDDYFDIESSIMQACS